MIKSIYTNIVLRVKTACSAMIQRNRWVTMGGYCGCVYTDCVPPIRRILRQHDLEQVPHDAIFDHLQFEHLIR